MFTNGFEKVAFNPMGTLNAVRKGAFSPVGKQFMKSHAITGALTGAAAGAMNAPEGQGLEGALKGGLIGGLGGAATGAVRGGIARNQGAAALRGIRNSGPLGRASAKRALPGVKMPLESQPQQPKIEGIRKNPMKVNSKTTWKSPYNRDTSH